MHLSLPPPQWLRLLSVLRHGGSVVIDSLFIVAPIVCVGSVFGPCFVIQNLCPSSFAVILMGKGKLVYLC